MGVLYLVPTPIGNLEDITLRAIRVLRECDMIVAEDTRHSLKLLNHYEIRKKMISYHDHSPHSKIDTIIEYLASHNIALITDAGTPGISDPGFRIVKRAIETNFKVVVLPGPSAVITALSASGLPTDSFRFFGFLPKKESHLRDFLKTITPYKETSVFFESPQRLEKTLIEILEVIGDRRITIAVELTKYFETFLRGTISSILLQENLTSIRGEVTIILQGKINE